MLKYHRSVRVAVTLLACTSMLVPADAQAFFGCFQKRQNAAAALYGGTVCNPCGQQLVCNYVPQTCYRTQTVAMPVTTMRPTCGVDPCTGCQTTVMRPVVTYQQQVQYVPYQSYRLQYSVAQPACPTAATTAYYAPTLSSGVAAPAATYAAPAYGAPTTTFAAPASGCSSCNSGVAATSYYAPVAGAAVAGYPMTTNYASVPTTRMLTPGVVVPGTSATNAAPNLNSSYNYPTALGNVSVNGYNYASPSASGMAAPSMYGSSSFTPAASAPAGAGPSYSTSNYGATYAAPQYSAPQYTAPSYGTPTMAAPSLGTSTTYAAPLGSVPSSVTPSYTTPSYSGSTYAGQPLSSAAPLSSSATAGSAYYTPSGAMVPVPQPTLNLPAAPRSTLQLPVTPNPTLANPGTAAPALTLPAAPIRPSYSSGVNPAATPAPTGPLMQPIPDPNINREPTINRELRLGNPTSTPALIDPEDKTAMALPTQRAWSYRPVGNVVQASYSKFVADDFPTTPTEVPTLPTTYTAPAEVAPANGTRLGAPRPAMEIEPGYFAKPQFNVQPQSATPQQPQPRRDVDSDGWRAAAR